MAPSPSLGERKPKMSCLSRSDTYRKMHATVPSLLQNSLSDRPRIRSLERPSGVIWFNELSCKLRRLLGRIYQIR